MSLKKGFLRESLLKPSRIEWVYALLIFLFTAVLFHLLIVHVYQFILFSFTNFPIAKYRLANDELVLYNTFIPFFNCITGLNFAFAFLLRNRLNGRSGRERFGFRLAYHYAQFNSWGYPAWFTRLMYHMVFLSLVLALDLSLVPEFNMELICLALLVSYYLNTWLMAHLVLRKAYFTYLKVSILCLSFALVLANIKSIDYDFYNQMVKQKSLYSEGDFQVPKVNMAHPTEESWRLIPLYLYENKGDSLPRLRTRKNRELTFLSVEEMKTHWANNDRALMTYVNKDVKLSQVWQIEYELKKPEPNKLLYYAALESQWSWIDLDFSYWWHSHARFIGACQLNHPSSLEGKTCRGLIDPQASEVLHIQYAKGLNAINNRNISEKDMLRQVAAHVKKFRHEAIILIEPDTELTFEHYTLFKDKIRSLIVEMRREFLLNKYDVTYTYSNYARYHSVNHQKDMEAAQLYPINLVNYDKKTGRMFSDYLK